MGAKSRVFALPFCSNSSFNPLRRPTVVQRKSRASKFRVILLSRIYYYNHVSSTETNYSPQWIEFRSERLIILNLRSHCRFQRIPKDQSEIREEIAMMKAERLARRAERESEEAKSAK